MLAVTIVELIIGFNAQAWGLLDPHNRTSSLTLKFIFIGLTIAKAFYIVYKFMHLGDEKKGMRYVILVPYTIFIVYFIVLMITEANYDKLGKSAMDERIVKQKEQLNKEAISGGGHHSSGGAENHDAKTEQNHDTKKEEHH